MEIKFVAEMTLPINKKKRPFCGVCRITSPGAPSILLRPREGGAGFMPVRHSETPTSS